MQLEQAGPLQLKLLKQTNQYLFNNNQGAFPLVIPNEKTKESRTMNIAIAGIAFLYGILIGSFLNVLIYRIPKHENFTTTRSHCMECGYQLRWYDLVPLFSYLFLRGKCRKCKAPISKQYPLVEFCNGVAYAVILLLCGFNVEGILYCLLFSALLALSVIDFRTYEIPVGFNLFILLLGIIRLATDVDNWLTYIIGFFAISSFIYMIILLTQGRGMGGGDCKLMACAGLLLGWKQIILAFVLGCILGSILHLIRMKCSDEEHVLAFGPYLSAGIMISALFGQQMIDWYLQFLL